MEGRNWSHEQFGCRLSYQEENGTQVPAGFLSTEVNCWQSWWWHLESYSSLYPQQLAQSLVHERCTSRAWLSNEGIYFCARWKQMILFLLVQWEQGQLPTLLPAFLGSVEVGICTFCLCFGKTSLKIPEPHEKAPWLEQDLLLLNFNRVLTALANKENVWASS